MFTIYLDYRLPKAEVMASFVYSDVLYRVCFQVRKDLNKNVSVF